MRTVIAIVIAAVILVAFSCSNERGGFFSRLLKGGGSGVPVTVESVMAQEVPETIIAAAVIAPAETVDVLVPAGVTIERILVADGDRVNAGDALARISAEDLNLRLARSREELREAQVSLEKNQYLLRNRDRLLEEERIDRQQYEGIETQVQADEASIERLRQEVQQLEARLGATTITSPAAGIVARRVSPTLAQAGAPLMVITKLDPAVALFRLKPEEAAGVAAGTPVRLIMPASGEEPLDGRIVAVDAAPDPADRMVGARAQVANPQGIFREGMRAEVELQGSRAVRTWIVPRDALIRDGRDYFVFTVSKGVAHKVQVIPSRTSGTTVEVARGLKDDDMVVVRGQDKVTEGTVVDIWGK